MTDKPAEQEPSIEEILASIRQIISDDDDKEDDGVSADPIPAPVQQKPPEPKPEPVAMHEEEVENEEEVLELTEMVEDEPIEIDLQDHEEPKEIVMPPLQTFDTNDILTESAKAATVASMAKLAANMPITRHREHGNITLEDLVREMLHPMLKDWLSDNLPPMVERMVQKELEKLARKAQDV